VGSRSFSDLRAALALAVTQGALLGTTAGCAGKTGRVDGERPDATGGQSAGGAGAPGGATSTGGSAGVSAGGSASAGGATSTGGSAGAQGGSATTGGSAGVSAGGGGSGQPAELEPYPLEKLGCSGPVLDGGYDGQCCVSARCYTPAEGECLAADERPPIPLPPGSGTCGCSVGEASTFPVSGPYAPNPGGTAMPDGTCCYLVGSVGCEGRPLVVAGAAVVAPLVSRADWCPALA
jgi:hypothetical protein